MKKAILLGTTGIAIAFAMLAFGYLAGLPNEAHRETDAVQPSASAANNLNKKQVEMILRDYLLNNSELLLEMQGALEAKQKKEQRIASLDVIKQSKDEIFNSTYDGIAGNPYGKVTIVEFYDYNCGYCKRAQADMIALTKANPDLRFVLKEFPILGPDSQKAHVVSMAFRKLMLKKYGEFHDKLLGSEGRAGEDNAIKLAVELGIDEAKLREAMKDPDIGEAFKRTYDLANKLQISGTPSYVIGNEVVFGALGQDVLAGKIAAAAACQKNSTC